MSVQLERCAGARRGLLQLPGVEEDVGMVGIHWRGRFIELVPWKGEVQVGWQPCTCNDSYSHRT